MYEWGGGAIRCMSGGGGYSMYEWGGAIRCMSGGGE